jgi:hypothetical protein
VRLERHNGQRTKCQGNIEINKLILWSSDEVCDSRLVGVRTITTTSMSTKLLLTDRPSVSVEIDVFIRGHFEAPILLDEHHPNHPRAPNRAQCKSSRCAETDAIPRLVVVWPQVRSVNVSNLSSMLAYGSVSRHGSVLPGHQRWSWRERPVDVSVDS